MTDRVLAVNLTFLAVRRKRPRFKSMAGGSLMHSAALFGLLIIHIVFVTNLWYSAALP